MEAGYLGIHKSHDPGFFCRRVVGNEYFFGYFETDFLYEQDGHLQTGHAGDMLVIPPGMPVYLGTEADSVSGYINDWIYLSGADIAALLARYPLPLGIAFPFGRTGLLRTYIENITQEISARMPGYQDQLLFMTGQLIISLHRSLTQPDADWDNAIVHTRETIMRMPEKHWTLAEMASLSGYSPSRFSALYHARFGISPKQDLLDARVEMAAQMLRYTNRSVTEIADLCGFHNIYYFSKYFKASRNQTPTEFRK